MARITSPKVRDSLFTKRQTRVFAIIVQGNFSGWTPAQKKKVKLVNALFSNGGPNDVEYELAKRITARDITDTYMKLHLRPKPGKHHRVIAGGGTPVSGTFTVTLSLSPLVPEETCYCDAIDYDA